MPPKYKPLLASKVKYIVIHCSASPPSQDLSAADIDRQHRKEGWNEIGYHRVIRRDGRVENGRPLNVPGAHVRGYNGKSVAICMVGGVTEGNVKVAENNFTEEQFITLRILVRQFKNLFPGAEVLGHRDLSPDKNRDGKVSSNEWLKQCPSFDVRDYFAKNPLI